MNQNTSQQYPKRAPKYITKSLKIHARIDAIKHPKRDTVKDQWIFFGRRDFCVNFFLPLLLAHEKNPLILFRKKSIDPSFRDPAPENKNFTVPFRTPQIVFHAMVLFIIWVCGVFWFRWGEGVVGLEWGRSRLCLSLANVVKRLPAEEKS